VLNHFIDFLINNAPLQPGSATYNLNDMLIFVFLCMSACVPLHSVTRGMDWMICDLI
jgi:hypothetical protein